MPRQPIPENVATTVLVRSRRRCALCFGLSHDNAVKSGQIAHVDRDASNSALDNLAWLCLEHHDQYDSRTSQSRGLTTAELTAYRAELYAFNERARLSLEPQTPATALSPQTSPLVRLLNDRSDRGCRLYPQIRIADLPGLTGISADELELLIDELREQGLLELNSSRDVIFPTDRLFWETDPLFTEHDPVTDAQELARFLVQQPTDEQQLSHISEVLGWNARRLNPAVTYLHFAGLINDIMTLGMAPFAVWSVTRTPRTRRFVRDLDGDAA